MRTKEFKKNIFQTTMISMQKFLRPPSSIRKFDVWHACFIGQTNRSVDEEKLCLVCATRMQCRVSIVYRHYMLFALIIRR